MRVCVWQRRVPCTCHPVRSRRNPWAPLRPATSELDHGVWLVRISSRVGRYPPDRNGCARAIVKIILALLLLFLLIFFSVRSGMTCVKVSSSLSRCFFRSLSAACSQVLVVLFNISLLHASMARIAPVRPFILLLSISRCLH